VFFTARSGPQSFVGIELHIGSVCWFEESYHHQSREDRSPADARGRFDSVSSIINPDLIDRRPGDDGVSRVPLWGPVERASGNSPVCLEDLPVGKDDINSFRLITRAGGVAGGDEWSPDWHIRVALFDFVEKERLPLKVGLKWVSLTYGLGEVDSVGDSLVG